MLREGVVWEPFGAALTKWRGGADLDRGCLLSVVCFAPGSTTFSLSLELHNGNSPFFFEWGHWVLEAFLGQTDRAQINTINICSLFLIVRNKFPAKSMYLFHTSAATISYIQSSKKKQTNSTKTFKQTVFLTSSTLTLNALENASVNVYLNPLVIKKMFIYIQSGLFLTNAKLKLTKPINLILLIDHRMLDAAVRSQDRSACRITSARVSSARSRCSGPLLTARDRCGMPACILASSKSA